MPMPSRFPTKFADQRDYARRIADKHLKLDPAGRKVCLDRIKQENPCLARLVQQLLKGDQGACE